MTTCQEGQELDLRRQHFHLGLEQANLQPTIILLVAERSNLFLISQKDRYHCRVIRRFLEIIGSKHLHNAIPSRICASFVASPSVRLGTFAKASTVLVQPSNRISTIPFVLFHTHILPEATPNPGL